MNVEKKGSGKHCLVPFPIDAVNLVKDYDFSNLFFLINNFSWEASISVKFCIFIVTSVHPFVVPLIYQWNCF